MERVETLLEKLQQQVKAHSPVNQLLFTTQMLQHELVHLHSNLQEPVSGTGNGIQVSMPLYVIPALVENVAAATTMQQQPPAPEKEYTVLEVDEAAIEAELEEIKKNAAAIQQLTSAGHKPAQLADLTDDDIPTLAQQPAATTAKAAEINELAADITLSVNDILKTPMVQLSEKLSESSVKDLRKAIGINERFLYINDLFRGDEVMYERSIKTINGFSILAEAEYWIRRELKTKLGWADSEPVVVQFDQLVKRRFS